ncbi:flagellar hook protein FlgL [Cohnella kolymensis]|uniref:Flagellar hook protein FlgL n=1 Tax=Cohnella kolymensis TaxID=1590652 RepID=A0ABR5A6T9_9BACL|nr:flagellar hook-associated protein FlgL [Cohnella kolymensis]KIL36695.1 flagellar hook protein FlgL [Cohnella kolymensis]
MPLRVTPGMIHDQMVRNLNKNLHRMSGAQTELTTGRRINKPSDDPIGITYALRYRSELSMNDQYQRNLTAAQSSVEHVDNVLGQVNDLMQRVKELTIQGANGTNPAEARQAIKSELDVIYDHLITIGNDQINGKYTFNGQLTQTAPYDAVTAGTIDTDDQQIKLPVAPGIEIGTNMTGNQVFGKSTDTDNLFTVVKQIRAAFNLNDGAAAAALLSKVDSRYNALLSIRSEVGARANRIDMLDNRNKDLDITLNNLSGKTEDADIADATIRLKRDENVYQASLSVGARIIQPSLVDYLK